jgi:hypothetical protein
MWNQFPEDSWILFWNRYFELRIFLNWRISLFLKNNHITSLIGEVFVLFDCWYIWLRNSLYSQSEGIVLIEVKSCNALLHMLVICICGYLKLFLRNNFLILNTCCPGHFGSTCVRLWGFVVIFCSQKGSVSKKIWEVLP